MIIDRIKFWFAKKRFIYAGNGSGFAFSRYRIFADVVEVRRSQFGYVTGWDEMTREEYLQIAEGGVK